MEMLEEHISKAESAFYKKKWKQAIKLWTKIIESYPETSFLIGDAKLQISIAQRILHIRKCKKEILNYKKERNKRKSVLAKYPKIAMYTVITDNYDSLKLPEKINTEFEYIVFSDKPISGGGVWQVKPILSHFEDPVRTSRFIKLHPHHLLKDFDIAIYIDSNLMILGDISSLIERFLESEMPIGAIRHPYRKSIYEEIEACVSLKKDNQDIMRKQINRYRNEKFKDENLVEANFLFFDLKNKKTEQFLNYWWEELENGSRRDQLSFNYALNKSGANFCSLMDEAYTTRNSPLLAWVHHDYGKGPAQTLINKLKFPTEDPFSNESYASIKEINLKSMGASIDIVLHVDDHTKRYRECLESINNSRIYSKYNLLILDNSSIIDVKNFLKGFKVNKSWVDISCATQLKKNQYIDFLNYGLKKTKSDFVVILSADMLVNDGWAEKLVDSLLSDNGAGLASPVTNYSTSNLKKLDAKYEAISQIGIHPQVNVVDGNCFVISRKVINEIGYFDYINFTDRFCYLIDYCFRASNKGFLSLTATHTCVAQLGNIVKDTKKSIDQSYFKLMEIYSSSRVDRLLNTNEHPLLTQLRRYAESSIEIDPSLTRVKTN